jgi:hypothetical protein
MMTKKKAEMREIRKKRKKRRSRSEKVWDHWSEKVLSASATKVLGA